MKSTLQFVTFVCWALWFGATIGLFVFAPYFRRTLSDSNFHEAAHALFQVYGTYALVLAGLILLSSGLLLVSYPSKALVVLLGALILAGGMAVAVALGLMPEMESLRNQGLTQSEEFKKLHGKSMVALLLQSIMLLLSGLLFMWELKTSRAFPVDSEVDEPTDPPSHRRAGLSQRA